MAAPLDSMKIEFTGDIGPLKQALKEAQQQVGQSAQGIQTSLDGLNKKFDELGGLLTGKVSGAFQDFASQAGTTGRALSIFGPAGIAAAAAIGAVSAAALSGVEKLQAMEQSTLKLNAVLTATGNNIGMTADQINKLSSSLSKNSLISAPEIRDAATAVASFGSVAYTELDKVLKLSMNMASVLGGDVKTNAIMLAKVFEDPANNLGKFGRMFDEATKDSIKSMAAMGDKAGAIALIVETLEKRLGGASEAEAQGLTGAMLKATKAWGGLNSAIADSLGLLDWFERKAKASAAAAGAIADVLKIFNSPEYKLKQIDETIAERQKALDALQGANPAMRFLSDPGGVQSKRLQDEIDRLKQQRGVVGSQQSADETQRQENESNARLGKLNSVKEQDAAAAALAKKRADEAAALIAAQQAAAFDNLLLKYERQKELVGKSAEDQQKLTAQWAAEDILAGQVNAKRQAELDTRLKSLVVAQQIAALEAQAQEQLKVQEDANQKLDDYIKNLKEAARLAGISKEATKEQTALLEAQKIAKRQLTADEETSIRNAEKLKDTNAKAVQAAEDSAKRFTQFWDRAAQRIGDGLADALVAGFDRGQSGMQLFMDAFKRLALQAVAESLSAAFFRPAVASVFGALGLGSSAAGAGGGVAGSGGGGLLSGLGSIGGMLSGAASMFSGGFGSIGSSIGSYLPSGLTSSIGSLFGGGAGGGGVMAGIGAMEGGGVAAGSGMSASAMAAGNAAGMGFGSFLGPAAGVYGLYQATQAQSHLGGALGGAASGAMIGSMFGPPGMVVGAIGGALLGGIMGGKPSVGPNGNAFLGYSGGQFGVGVSSADNGYNPAGPISEVQKAADAINKLMSTPGVTVDPSKFDPYNRAYGVGDMSGQRTGSAESIIQSLVQNGAINGPATVINAALSGKIDAALAQIQGQALAQTVTAYITQAQRLTTAFQGLATQLSDTVKSLKLDSALSPLTPLEKLNEAQSQYGSVLALAKDKDPTAMANLSGSSRSYLAAVQDYYGRASGDYRNAFNQVSGDLTGVSGQAQARADALSSISSQLNDAGNAALSAESTAQLATLVDTVDRLARSVGLLAEKVA